MIVFGHDVPVCYVPCLENPWVFTIYVYYVPVSQGRCVHHIPDLFITPPTQGLFGRLGNWLIMVDHLASPRVSGVPLVVTDHIQG
jgi:hypothetical protein